MALCRVGADYILGSPLQAGMPLGPATAMERRRLPLLFLTILAAFVMGCSSGLSSRGAGAAIDDSLRRVRISTWVHTGRIGTDCAIDPTKDEVLIAAQKAGLVTVTPDGAGFWRVEEVGVIPLDKKGREEAPAGGCDFYTARQDLATKSLVEVTGIGQLTDGRAEAEFTWKWALTSEGKTLLKGLSAAQINDLEPYIDYPAYDQGLPFSLANIEQMAKPQVGKRTFTKSAEGWRLVADQESAADIVAQQIASKPKNIIAEIGRVSSNCPWMIQGTEVDIDENPEKDVDAIVAAKAGYISVVSDGKDYWRVSLTDKGRDLVHRSQSRGLYGHQVWGGCDYQIAQFAVARQSLVGIAAVTDDERSPEVQYLWKWIPTGLGLALTKKGPVYVTLTSAQRNDLGRRLSEPNMPPPLSLPAPPQGDNAVIRATVKLQKSKRGEWYF